MTPKITRRESLKLLGLAGLASIASLFAPARGRGSSSGDAAPNVLLILFDTLSARHMSLYGYPRQTTPNIERHAARAAVYHRHYAAGSFTTPGTASLLTGSYPWTHRAFHLYGSVLDSLAGRSLFSGLAPALPAQAAYTHNPLAQVLLEQCAAHAAGLEIVPLRRLALSDDRYAARLSGDYASAFSSELIVRQIDDRTRPASLWLSIPDYFYQVVRFALLNHGWSAQFPLGVPQNRLGAYFTLEEAVDWIPSLFRPANPTFAYVHLFPPHEPYAPRREFASLFAGDGFQPAAKPAHYFRQAEAGQAFLDFQRVSYDRYIAYADAEFGRLMDTLGEAGILDDTIVLLTSDHGQMFERGIHGHETPVLYEPLIRIPLVVWQPGAARRDIHAPTSAVDILPTLLHLLGQSAGGLEGAILPGLGGAQDLTRAVFALDAKQNAKSAPLTTATFAMMQGRHKVVRYLGYPGFADQTECYDLGNDAEELENLYPADPVSITLKDGLDEKIRSVNEAFQP
jgi:arylsulfatase A-like enzyme